MKLAVCGCNHHHAAVAVRERLAFSPAQAESALDRWRDRFPRAEAVLVSTCNRVELYSAAEDPEACPSHPEVVDFLAGFHGLRAGDVIHELFDRQGEDAVRHLFMVAASLDSMVLGEVQISSQVKQAYQVAADRQSAGPLSHTIFQRALRVAKRVGTETAIQQKRVSIPSVAVVDFGKQIFESFADKRVVVVGAGEMGDETIRFLRDEGARDVTVVNRNRERGEALAEKYSGAFRPWDELAEALVLADVVVSTTGATEPVVTAEFYKPVHRRRLGRALLVLDLAMPRDFDPKVGEFESTFLYNLDDLQVVCDRNLAERRKELKSAIAIVEEETATFMADLNHRATSPVIRRLKEDWRQVEEDELLRLFNRLPTLDDRARKEIRQSVDRLLNKLLHPPLESLRGEARQGVPHALLDALKTLFQIRD